MAGISEGFRIGFDYGFRSSLWSCSRNIGSAYDHPDVVSSYLGGERAHGRVKGPLQPSAATTQVSSFGVIPKRRQPDSGGLFLTCPVPAGEASMTGLLATYTPSRVNDAIARDLCSFSYISVADIASVVLSLGQGTLLAKSDIKHAYRQVPIHPDDRLLLGMRWNGQLFCDATLPFGLRSAPIIFSAVLMHSNGS